MKTLVLAFLLLFTASPAIAQESIQKREDVLRFFQIMSVGELAIADMRQFAKLQSAADPTIPSEFWDELFAELTPERLEEHLAPIYEKHFTHDQIKAWVAFFETEAGQAFVKKQRVVLEESMLSGQALVQEIGGPILHRLRNER